MHEVFLRKTDENAHSRLFLLLSEKVEFGASGKLRKESRADCVRAKAEKGVCWCLRMSLRRARKWEHRWLFTLFLLPWVLAFRWRSASLRGWPSGKKMARGWRFHISG